MKFLSKAKDGGPDSNVTGYWLVECKSLFSIVLLRFDKGSREAYHNHAFSAISWILKGLIKEDLIHSNIPKYLSPRVLPVYTSRKCFHKVTGITDTTWVLSFRGPWNKHWREYSPITGTFTTLTNGRKIVNEQNCSNRQST